MLRWSPISLWLGEPGPRPDRLPPTRAYHIYSPLCCSHALPPRVTPAQLCAAFPGFPSALAQFSSITVSYSSNSESLKNRNETLVHRFPAKKLQVSSNAARKLCSRSLRDGGLHVFRFTFYILRFAGLPSSY